jgi:cytochrome c553
VNPGKGIRTRLVLLLTVLVCSCAFAAEVSAPDTIEARAQGCSTCHGPHGEGVAGLNFPHIAGKPAGYLFNQLQNFRDGRRSYPPMNYLLAYLHDDYLAEFAQYFAAQASPGHPATVLPAAAGAAAERLVKQGDTDRGIPACIRCHGKLLTGIEPGVPGLLGLDERYVAAQLVSWRVGTRHAKDPDCMHQIASRLSEQQIGQVSAWLASQPVPNLATAAFAGSWKTPIACGSEP